MSGKWFSNRGQMIQVACAIVAVAIGLVSQWDQISARLDLWAIAKVLAYPTAAVLLFNIGGWYAAGRARNAASKQPDPPPPQRVTAPATLSERPASISKPQPSAKGPNGWEITDVYVRDVKIKVGSYWDDPIDATKLRISAVAIHEEPGRRSAELAIRTGGSIIYGGKESDEVSTNRYKITISRDGFDAEERSAFQFSFDDHHIHLFAIRVDGLDTAHNEIALQVARVRVRESESYFRITPS